MRKSKILKIVLLIILIVILIFCKIVIPPAVKYSERKSVTGFVENYLTNKYGDYNFKVTSVKYEYNMDYMSFFDYSNPVGYSVKYKNDITKNSYLTISGLSLNEYKIDNDNFLSDCYFSDLDGYERYNMFESIKPYKKITKRLLNDIRDNFDSSISDIVNVNVLLDISDNFGRIPLFEELKNNIDFYEVLSFTINYSELVSKDESYKNELRKYLSNTYKDDWKIYFNTNGSVSCFREKN